MKVADIFKILPQLFDKKQQPAENQRRLLLYPVNQGVRLGAVGAVIFGCLHCIPGVYFCIGGAFGIVVLEMILAFWVILHSPNNFDGTDVMKKGAEKEAVDLYKEIVERRDKRNGKTNSMFLEELFSITIEPSTTTKGADQRKMAKETFFPSPGSWFAGCNFIHIVTGGDTDGDGVTDVQTLRSIPNFSLN